MQHERRRTVYVAIGILVAITVVLAIVPRLLPEVELSRRTVLWVPVVHQIGVAALIAATIWLGFGRKRSVLIASALMIALVWGPNFLGAIEYSLTGKNENVFMIAETMGVTPILNTVYGFLYDSLGYSLAIRH